MKVLLYANMCNPDQASEPLVGYNTCRSIVDEVEEAVVVTQVRNREAIRRKGMGKAQVVYLDTERIAVPLWKIASSMRASHSVNTVIKLPGHYYFEYRLWESLKADLTNGVFDIVHRVTPISSAMPSPLAKWSPVPFVLGPVNGGLPWPPQFRSELIKEGEWLRYARGLYRLTPYAKSTYQRAAAVLAAYQHTISKLPAGGRDRIINFPENGVDPCRFSVRTHQKAERLTFVYIGKLMPYKSVNVVVSAFCRSDVLRKHRLLIVGDGSDREELERMVRANGMEGCVVFTGWVTQQEAARHLHDSDVFVYPAIRDSGAGALVEAMYTGLACIASDYGPMAELLAGDRGLPVPLNDREEHVEGFRKAMESLVFDEARRNQIGQRAHQFASEHFVWANRAKAILRVYKWVLGREKKPPEFVSSMP
jgi:glycosyltransferase involved in cell wall biosynthesis